ncbi:DUF1214 domain-containing protein [uncultured Erythrobacter sp.]|uniref:DUF1214 domain-containing protein n=1 Tax=uncultured Erythrobacter sp. TaxID=263913 RepID=UPI00261AB0C3|nr:DUF1214 domain-containing protein [uncultured Erythrobacter sp.]
MIKRVGAYALALIIGLIAGPASALYMAGLWPGADPLDFGNIEIDGWRSDFAIGSEAADPYTRARVARHGLLGLAKSEAVYFTRTVDNEGRAFSEACNYRISGGAMPASWWSITLYNGESFLPDNTDGALSIDATQLNAVDGPWEAMVAAQRPEAGMAWISSKAAGNFDLTLRLYVPKEALLEAPEDTITPPTVERLSCEGEAA